MDASLTQLHERLHAWCGTLGAAESCRPEGVTVLDVDDIPVLISTFEDGQATWVRLAAVAATRLSPNLDLLHELLQANVSSVVGAWQLFDDGTLVFAATLPGSGLDQAGFAATLRRVARAACSPPLPPPCGGDRFGASPTRTSTNIKV